MAMYSTWFLNFPYSLDLPRGHFSQCVNSFLIYLNMVNSSTSCLIASPSIFNNQGIDISVIMLPLTRLWSSLWIEFTKSSVQEFNKNCRLRQSWNPQPTQVRIFWQLTPLPPNNGQCSLWTTPKSKLFLFLNSLNKILLKSENFIWVMVLAEIYI